MLRQKVLKRSLMENTMNSLAGRVAIITGGASGIGRAVAVVLAEAGASGRDADEIYYVVSGKGKLVLGDEEFTVSKGMTIFIPANVHHQSFNPGDEDLVYVYYFIFALPPGGPAKQDSQGWVKIA